LFIRSPPDVAGQRPIPFREVRTGAVHAGSSGLMIGNGVGDTLIETASFDVGFQLKVNRLIVAFVRPLAQLFPLRRRQRVNGLFDILHCVYFHSLSGIAPFHETER
jgi:hypothetical protein